MRKTRPQPKILGRRELLPGDVYKSLVSSINPVRDQPYEIQINKHNLPIKKSALQRGLKRNADEAHIDPSSQGINYILREEGTRYNPDNIQQRSER